MGRFLGNIARKVLPVFRVTNYFFQLRGVHPSFCELTKNTLNIIHPSSVRLSSSVASVDGCAEAKSAATPVSDVRITA